MKVERSGFQLKCIFFSKSKICDFVIFGPNCTSFNVPHPYMKSFIAKRVNSILVNLRYLRFKLLKYKENKKNIFNTFDHNFKNIPLYIMRKVSLERYYFVLYDGALTLKLSKMVLNSFCDKTSSYACVTKNCPYIFTCIKPKYRVLLNFYILYALF